MVTCTTVQICSDVAAVQLSLPKQSDLLLCSHLAYPPTFLCCDLEGLSTCSNLKWFFLTATLIRYAFQLNVNVYDYMQAEFQGCLQTQLLCTGPAFVRSVKSTLSVCTALQRNQPALHLFAGSFGSYFRKVRILALSRCHISHLHSNLLENRYEY